MLLKRNSGTCHRILRKEDGQITKELQCLVRISRLTQITSQKRSPKNLNLNTKNIKHCQDSNWWLYRTMGHKYILLTALMFPRQKHSKRKMVTPSIPELKLPNFHRSMENIWLLYSLPLAFILLKLKQKVKFSLLRGKILSHLNGHQKKIISFRAKNINRAKKTRICASGMLKLENS